MPRTWRGAVMDVLDDMPGADHVRWFITAITPNATIPPTAEIDDHLDCSATSMDQARAWLASLAAGPLAPVETRGWRVTRSGDFLVRYTARDGREWELEPF